MDPLDIEKIKSGRPKPRFVISLEWITLGTLTLVLLSLLAAQTTQAAIFPHQLFTFLLLIEIGVLSTLYGAEGIRYGIIWLTFPAPSGPRRAGFRGLGAVLIGTAYVLMGLTFIVLAILVAYLGANS
jgi:hypothetical protein